MPTKKPIKKNVLIGKTARRLLRTTRSYQQILEVLHQDFPESNTTIGSLRWYASKMRQDKIKVPVRARTVRGKG